MNCAVAIRTAMISLVPGGHAALDEAHFFPDPEGRRLDAAQGHVGHGARAPLQQVDDDKEFRRGDGAALAAPDAGRVLDDAGVGQGQGAAQLTVAPAPHDDRDGLAVLHAFPASIAFANRTV